MHARRRHSDTRGCCAAFVGAGVIVAEKDVIKAQSDTVIPRVLNPPLSTDLDNLPEPDELAGEIIDNLEAGLESFRAIAEVLG